MPTVRIALVCIVAGLLVPGAFAQKDKLPAAVDTHADVAWKMAGQIWEWAEPGYLETKSATLLADDLEKAGFKVDRGVVKIPTAFTATFGSGSPVIGILGEYDALPELAQEGVPFREIREGGTGAGHACGHHLFGVASATAAKVIAEQVKAGKLKGTVRFYGCPAEEGGAAKAFMVRDGLFADCDAVLHWHPGSRNVAGDQSCLARIAVKFRFHGTPAHAAGSPERGRSALDALTLTMHAVELLREHTPDGTRLHHTITAGRRGGERGARVRRRFFSTSATRRPRRCGSCTRGCSSVPKPGRWRPRRNWRSCRSAGRWNCCRTTPSRR